MPRAAPLEPMRCGAAAAAAATAVAVAVHAYDRDVGRYILQQAFWPGIAQRAINLAH